MKNNYRVNLDIYNGPLDLLLYLIRRDEVDIYDIPVAHITQQYVKHVELLQEIDPNIVGDFMVLAATLIEIKTRMLLPTPEIDDPENDEAGIDPRSELVRQLLEYKSFKDAAGDLYDAKEIQKQKFPRRPILPETDQRDLELEDVQIWHLVDAFGGLMESIGQQITEHGVVYDDTPIELHAVDIMDRLGREGSLTFSKVFEGRTSKSEVVGLFLAMLELMRQKKIRARQEEIFSEIRIFPNDEPPEEQASADEPQDQDLGKYVSQKPAEAESANLSQDSELENDDTPGEPQETGS